MKLDKDDEKTKEFNIEMSKSIRCFNDENVRKVIDVLVQLPKLELV